MYRIGVPAGADKLDHVRVSEVAHEKNFGGELGDRSVRDLVPVHTLEHDVRPKIVGENDFTKPAFSNHALQREVLERDAIRLVASDDVSIRISLGRHMYLKPLLERRLCVQVLFNHSLFFGLVLVKYHKLEHLGHGPHKTIATGH